MVLRAGMDDVLHLGPTMIWKVVLVNARRQMAVQGDHLNCRSEKRRVWRVEGMGRRE